MFLKVCVVIIGSGYGFQTGVGPSVLVQAQPVADKSRIKVGTVVANPLYYLLVQYINHLR